MCRSPAPARRAQRWWVTPVIWLWLAALPSEAAPIDANRFKWDQSLPSIPLEQVQIAAPTLTDAWIEIGQHYMLRSVLVTAGSNVADSQPFSCTRDRCRGSDVLDAITAAYPHMTWTQDQRSGVIWLHPRDLPYERILDTKVVLTSDEFGLPMQDGVLQSLAACGALSAWPYGQGFRATYNFPVDLAAGTYTTRELLNRCCSANPTVTLAVMTKETSRDYTIVQAINLVHIRYRDEPPPPGAIQIWRLGIGPVKGGDPTLDLVRSKLADPDPLVRFVARSYYWATWPRYKIQAGPGFASLDPQTRVWMLLTISELFCRLASTLPDDMKQLRQLASNDALLTWPAELAVPLAMELARLDHDTKYLDIVSQREFKPGELSNVRSRIHQLARMSPEVRLKMRGELGRRLGAADHALPALANISPNPPKDRNPVLTGGTPPVVEFKLQQPVQTQPEP